MICQSTLEENANRDKQRQRTRGKNEEERRKRDCTACLLVDKPDISGTGSADPE